MGSPWAARYIAAIRTPLTACLSAGTFICIGLVCFGGTAASAAAGTSRGAVGRAAAFEPCGRDLLLDCTRVAVPLDRSGTVPGRVALFVKRLQLPGPTRGTVVALAGGPGQAATPFTDYIGFLFRKAIDGRDVVAFDQRGTGRSGILRCPTLEALGERLLYVAGAASDCAQSLGPRRAFYTTRDSVEDLEAVRQAIGVERITLLAVSYGTKLALAYAAAYPSHVDRLVLDSPVDVTGPDPFARDSFAAIPRVLRLLCARACARFSPDPVADLGGLVGRLGRGLEHGPLVRDDGRIYQARIGRLRLLNILFAGDLDPTLRSAAPGAVRSALNGDSAPLLRLAHRAGRSLEEPISDFSPAVFAATQCEEGPLPWARSTQAPDRLPEAEAELGRTPLLSLAPFDRSTAFAGSSVVQLCPQWPTAARVPALATGPPPQPTLVLAGEDDLRTPLETASAIAGRLPRSRLLAVPDTGHSVLGSPAAGCARSALRLFLAGDAVGRCPRKPRLFPTEPIAPTAVDQLRPIAGLSGRAGRTLAALVRTLDDSGAQLLAAVINFDIFRSGIGGLRGGRVKLKSYGLALDRVEYVPGVKVSGRLEGEALSRGVLRVSGPAATAGSIRLRHGVMRGEIGGHRVRLSLPARILGGEERLRGGQGRRLARLRQSIGGGLPMPAVGP